MTTPALDYEDVRVAVTKHIEVLPGWRVAAHLFGGVDKQGAIMGGARSFQVKIGASRAAPGPMGLDRSGADYLATTLRVRIRQSYQPLQAPGVASTTLADRRTLERHIRAASPELPVGLQLRWIETGEPTEAVAGFLDTDLLIEARHWSVVSGPVGAGQGGGSL